MTLQGKYQSTLSPFSAHAPFSLPDMERGVLDQLTTDRKMAVGLTFEVAAHRWEAKNTVKMFVPYVCWETAFPRYVAPSYQIVVNVVSKYNLTIDRNNKVRRFITSLFTLNMGSAPQKKLIGKRFNSKGETSSVY